MPSKTPINKISEKSLKEYRGQVLKWYDKYQRILPWRYVSGQTPDPYRVWISEVMLQQTTVTAVKPYFEKFLSLWPTVEDLAATPREDVMSAWAGLGYYSRARNLHSCAQIIANDYNGIFPQSQKELKSLPGIGDYTSAALMTIAFNQPATVVDGNVERVMARLFAITDPLPKSKPLLKSIAAQWFNDFKTRPGDLAQALMDLGATICTPKSPKCNICPLEGVCKAKKINLERELPKKTRKKPKPQKIGHVYWIKNNKNQILLHKRPDKGLLGGMIALPTSDWLNQKQERNLSDPKAFKVKNTQKSINHSFTHFDLQLILKEGSVRDDPLLEKEYMWCNVSDLDQIGFPSVFQKALKLFQT